MKCPGAEEALRVKNCHGMVPSGIAEFRKHKELEKLLQDHQVSYLRLCAHINHWHPGWVRKRFLLTSEIGRIKGYFLDCLVETFPFVLGALECNQAEIYSILTMQLSRAIFSTK